MRLGILGLPKVGKTTLFNLLTGSRQTTDKFAASRDTHVGLARVPDPRLERLRDLYSPKKFTPATVEYVDIPGIQKGGGPESLDLNKLREMDGLVHVVRAFEDPELPHAGSSPSEDVETVDLELVLADLDIVERRIGKLEAARKRGLTPEESREKELLEGVVRPALEAETPVREVELSTEDEKRLRGFGLLTAKPMLLVINVDEDKVGEASAESVGLRERPGIQALVISAPIEDEIGRLDASEAAEFLSDLGLDEPGLDRVLQASYALLGLISFFTVGADEVRAWTIRRGTVARSAAGAIHTDLEKGFIRAEVVPWEELLDRGSTAACREAGSLRLEGKEYVVRDGEVVHFRFNV